MVVLGGSGGAVKYFPKVVFGEVARGISKSLELMETLAAMSATASSTNPRKSNDVPICVS